MKYIYIVNTCDNWKSYSSMEKQIVTTSWRRAYKKVLELIKENDFEVGDQEMLNSCRDFPNNYPDINTTVQKVFIERWAD